MNESTVRKQFNKTMDLFDAQVNWVCRINAHIALSQVKAYFNGAPPAVICVAYENINTFVHGESEIESVARKAIEHCVHATNYCAKGEARMCVIEFKMARLEAQRLAILIEDEAVVDCLLNLMG